MILQLIVFLSLSLSLLYTHSLTHTYSLVHFHTHTHTFTISHSHSLTQADEMSGRHQYLGQQYIDAQKNSTALGMSGPAALGPGAYFVSNRFYLFVFVRRVHSVSLLFSHT
jgi:hypothetical protein